MALRLIEIIASDESRERIQAILEQHDTLDVFSRQLADGRELIQVLIKTGNTEGVLDELETYYAHEPGFRLMVRSVDATIPAVEAEEEKPEESPEEKKKAADRISRQELYSNVSKGAEPSRYFYLNVVIATVVASIGLVGNDTAVIIAAMVIAPLLGPNMSLALATTLGDKTLIRRSLLTNGKGLLLTLFSGLVISALLLIFNEGDVTLSPAIRARADFDGIDVILALAAGSAGALAYIHGVAGSLVGVMVAVALLPPFLSAVILGVHGDADGAVRCFMLFVANVAGANIAGVSAFLLSGIRPRIWWEADRAKRAARRALFAWSLVIAVLLLMLYFLS